jgi:predicted RNA-binding Zn-ribbon protein involved in translation (DUF1610 family)
MAGENKSILMRCGRCNRQVPIGELKYDRDGKTLLCYQCRGAKPEPVTESKIIQSAEQTRQHYFCTACGYHFTRANIVPQRCPYCGKESIVEEKAVASGRLLDDA